VQTSVFLGVSIDGFIAREDGSLDFLTPFEGEPHGYEQFMQTVDALVVGRGTYDTVLGFDTWPWANKRVVVLTHRPIAGTHGETTHNGPLAPLVKRLADQGIRRIYLDGGKAIRHGLDEDLVDDMTLTIVPRTIGAGRPLFGTGASHTTAWAVTSVHNYATGLVQVCYQRTR